MYLITVATFVIVSIVSVNARDVDRVLQSQNGEVHFDYSADEEGKSGRCGRHTWHIIPATTDSATNVILQFKNYDKGPNNFFMVIISYNDADKNVKYISNAERNFNLRFNNVTGLIIYIPPQPCSTAAFQMKYFGGCDIAERGIKKLLIGECESKCWFIPLDPEDMRIYMALQDMNTRHNIKITDDSTRIPLYSTNAGEPHENLVAVELHKSSMLILNVTSDVGYQCNPYEDRQQSISYYPMNKEDMKCIMSSSFSCAAFNTMLQDVYHIEDLTTKPSVGNNPFSLLTMKRKKLEGAKGRGSSCPLPNVQFCRCPTRITSSNLQLAHKFCDPRMKCLSVKNCRWACIWTKVSLCPYHMSKPQKTGPVKIL